MELYKDALADDSAMIRTGQSPTQPPSLEQYPQVKRIRRLLLILVGINLTLCIVNFLFVIHSYAASDTLESQSPNSSTQLTAVIVALIFYGFGLLVVHRYYQTGLLVFTILGVVSLVLNSILIVVLLIRIVQIANHEGFVSAGLIVAIIFVSICCLVLILQLLVTYYAFKLYRLLKHNCRLTIEQI